MSKKNKNGGKKIGNGNHNGNTKPTATGAPAAGPAPHASQPASAPATPTVKSPAARREAVQKERFARDFSQVVAVLMRAPNYKNLRISDLEWLVIPPLLAGQSKVALSRYSKEGPIVPVAAALWARVSPIVDKRLSENLDKPPLLRASEWTSGDILWLMTLAGEPNVLAEFLPQLRISDFKDRPVKMRMQSEDGKAFVQTLQAAAPVKG